MKRVKLVVMVVGIVGLLFALTPEVWANGEPAPGDECCVVINPGGGALALKGTAALEVVPLGLADFSLDVLLRLERSGNQHFFRLNLTGVDLTPLTDQGILCLVLNPLEFEPGQNRIKITAFVNQILSAFFTGLSTESTRLVITLSSFSDFQGVFSCDDPNEEGHDRLLCEIPGTIPPRIFTMGEITIFAVDADRVNFLTPSCTLQE